MPTAHNQSKYSGNVFNFFPKFGFLTRVSLISDNVQIFPQEELSLGIIWLILYFSDNFIRLGYALITKENLSGVRSLENSHPPPKFSNNVGKCIIDSIPFFVTISQGGGSLLNLAQFFNDTYSYIDGS